MLTLSFMSCVSRGFYSEIKSNKKVYYNYLQYEGNKNDIKHLNKFLINTKKIIVIGTYIYPDSYRIIYDCTNNTSFFIENNVFNKESKYYSGSLNEKDKQLFSNLVFTLNYVLDSKMEELEIISQESFHIEPRFINIRILDITKKTYEEYQINSFDVYKDKPIMTEEEYWNIDWN